MKEIKFRAWDKKRDIMEYRDFEEINNYGWVLKSYFDDFVFMQYTGLKDKNNYEIWEGDIVEWECGDRGIVEFNYSAFIIKWIDPIESEWDYMNEFVEDGVQLVIGNIYESPELLKEKK